MRREGGFTLLELLGSFALIGAVSVVAGGLAHHAQRTGDLGAAYANDVAETRRALGRIEHDLRGARGVRSEGGAVVVATDEGDVTWRLDGTALRRRSEVVARNVAEFAATRRDDGLVEVRLALGRRSPDARGTARVETVVRPRAAAEASK